jgi:endonuclease YncB( thermonuclease family)
MKRQSFRKRQKPRLKKEHCRVVEVIDGDTITVKREHYAWFFLLKHSDLIRVRLAYIDTPELRQHQRGAKNARQVLARLLRKRRVIIEYQELAGGAARTEMYNRMLAVVHLDRMFLPNLNVNEYLLRKGVARLYNNPDNITPHHQQRFIQAEQYARRTRRGLWHTTDTPLSDRIPEKPAQIERSNSEWTIPPVIWLLTGILLGLLAGLIWLL